MFQELRNFHAVKSGYKHFNEGGIERQVAAEWFEHAFRQGRIKRLSASLLGRSRQLCNLSQAAQVVVNQHHAGAQTIALNVIRGSENRTHEFDVDFFPVEEHIEQRWLNVAVAHIQGSIMSPVELIKFGDIFYVRDGHHRISVAHARGQVEIDAVVTVWEAAT